MTALGPAAATSDRPAAHRPAGSLARDGWAVALGPVDAGWGFAGLRIGELAPGATLGFETGDDEVVVLPLSGAFRVAGDGESFELAGRPDVFAGPTDFVYLPPGRRVTVSSPAGGRFAVPSARAADRFAARRVPASAVPIELRGAGPASREVRNFGGPRCPRGRPADRLRGPHPGRRLVVLPAPQARRGRTRGDGPRGDLLLRGGPGSGRSGHRLPAGVRPTRPPDRRPGRGPHRRPRPHPARLARAVDGRARLRPLLPQRDGRAGPGACLADRRRPGPRLGPRDMAEPAGRSAAAVRPEAMGALDDHRATDGRAGDRPVPGDAAERAGRRGPAAHRGLLRHLRARQRRRARRGAPRGGARDPRGAALPPGAERAGDGPRGRRVRPDARPPVDPGLRVLGRPRCDEHGHRRGPRHGQPVAGPAPAERHLHDPGRRPGPPAARAPDGRRRVRQRRVPPGVALLRPGVATGAAPGGAARARCAC